MGLKALGGRCIAANEMDPYAASIYRNHFGSAPQLPHDNTNIRHDRNDDDVIFGWSLDVDGRFACVVNDRGMVYMFRHDEGYWEQVDELYIEYAHKCDTAGDVVAIRNLGRCATLQH